VQGAKRRVLLGDQDVQRFRDQGFLVLPRIASRADLESLRTAVDAAVRTGAGVEQCDEDTAAGETSSPTRRRYQFLPDLHVLNPALASARYRKICDGIARQLLGGIAALAGMAVYYKPARRGSSTPWHQDAGYVPMDYPESLSFWMALDDVTPANGCLYFIPASHRWGVRPHRRRNGDPALKTLTTDVAPEEIAAAVPCALQAGAATVHGLRTLHFSGPNVTARGRRAVILDYQLTAASTD
jgi:ectoine hydroxylase-related dioxygenase (phytanoyl-CoA dioxygenase family)